MSQNATSAITQPKNGGVLNSLQVAYLASLFHRQASNMATKMSATSSRRQFDWCLSASHKP